MTEFEKLLNKDIEKNVEEKNTYCNYHCHKSFSNIKQVDAISSIEDFIKRSIELGHESISTCEHGGAGNSYNTWKLAKEYGIVSYNHNSKLTQEIIHKKEMKRINKDDYYENPIFELKPLKYLHVIEIYFKSDLNRRKANHLIIIAKNDEGRKQLNKEQSKAVLNQKGFWTTKNIKALNPNNFTITSACLASPINNNTMDDWEETFEMLYNHFGTNLLLEVQCHLIEEQKEYNKHMINLSNQYGLELIAGVDSHYIYKDQDKLRTILLKSRGIDYGSEDSCLLDYPSREDLFNRFLEQGVLSENQIHKALNNTLITDETIGVNHNYDIKLPMIHKDKKSLGKDFIKKVTIGYKRLIEGRTEAEIAEYKKEIQYEIDVFQSGDMIGYPLLCYYVLSLGEGNTEIIDGKEYKIKGESGIATKTGRGSAGGSLVHNCLNITTLDRLDSEVPLLFERFISKDRLESGILPDVDLNLSDRAPFLEACKSLLGKENAYFMVKEDCMQLRASIKLAGKEYFLSVEEQDRLIEIVEKFDSDFKDENKSNPHNKKNIWDDEFTILNDKEKDVIRLAYQFIGIVTGISAHSCGALVYKGDIEAEFGLLRTKAGDVCCSCTGGIIDTFNFIKLDLLKVSNWAIIGGAYKSAKLTIPTTRELAKKVYSESVIWKLIDDGITSSVCQMDTKNSQTKIMKFKPRSIGEISDFNAKQVI